MVPHIKITHEISPSQPLKGKKFQLVGRVMRLGLCQAPAGIGDDTICTIITSLVEHSTQTRPTGISMKLKWPGEVCVGKKTMVHRHFRSSKDD